MSNPLNQPIHLAIVKPGYYNIRLEINITETGDKHQSNESTTHQYFQPKSYHNCNKDPILRRCNYCSSPSHFIRSCPIKAEDNKKYKYKTDNSNSNRLSSFQKAHLLQSITIQT